MTFIVFEPKISKRIILICIILSGAVNSLIFINRNNGFEYKKFSNFQELYPLSPSNSFFNKWQKLNQRFNNDELNEGLILLKTQIGIDKIFNDEKRITAIAGWLFNSFSNQLGSPSDTLSGLSPLQQYKYLEKHKGKRLWCGHFQAMFGFFCTVVGLSNRYVEIVPTNINISPDYHEVNEVYIPGVKKWVMVDVTRNILLIKLHHQPFSAADYLNFILGKRMDSLAITKSSTDSVFAIKEIYRNILEDKYFNENHLLRYYYDMNLSDVYTSSEKVKKYVFGKPWYEMYDPGKKHNHFLFRVKQFFFFSMFFLIFVYCSLIYFYKIKK